MLSQSNSPLLQSKQLRVSPRAPLALVESPDASEVGFCTREVLTKEPNGYSLGTKKKLDESWGRLLNHWIWNPHKPQGVADDTPNTFIQSQQSHAIRRPSYQPPAGSGYLKSIMAGLMKKHGCSYQFKFKKKGHLILNDSTWILGGSSVGISPPSLPEVLPAHPRATAALCRQLAKEGAKMTRWWCRMPSWAAGWIKHARFVIIVFKQMQTTRMILDDWLKPHKT